MQGGCSDTIVCLLERHIETTWHAVLEQCMYNKMASLLRVVLT
jgi:hypothetical protein